MSINTNEPDSMDKFKSLRETDIYRTSLFKKYFSDLINCDTNVLVRNFERNRSPRLSLLTFLLSFCFMWLYSHLLQSISRCVHSWYRVAICDKLDQMLCPLRWGKERVSHSVFRHFVTYTILPQFLFWFLFVSLGRLCSMVVSLPVHFH